MAAPEGNGKLREAEGLLPRAERGLGNGARAWHVSAMSITATVKNDTIMLPPGVHVPDGTEVEILLPDETVVPQDGATLHERMKDFIGCIKDGPEDLAAEHDYYAHGAPKRNGR